MKRVWMREKYENGREKMDVKSSKDILKKKEKVKRSEISVK